MTGLRPIVDLSYSSFLYMAMDQFVNQVAKNRYMFGGQASMPVVFRSAMFYGLNTGAHHSDRPYPMFMNVPGLKIVVPASPKDAKGLLRTAVDSDDPVLIFEACMLWGTKEDVPEEEYRIPFGKARTVREGSDVTRRRDLQCGAGGGQGGRRAGRAGHLGRGARPAHAGAVGRRRDRLVACSAPDGWSSPTRAHRTCSAAAEISAIVAEEAFSSLTAPIVRVTTPDTQIPSARRWKSSCTPTA